MAYTEIGYYLNYGISIFSFGTFFALLIYLLYMIVDDINKISFKKLYRFIIKCDDEK